MGGKTEERLSWKEPMHSLEVELEREYGLSPVQARALVRRVGEILEGWIAGGSGARGPGQVSYSAVAVGEKAGKPVRYCLTVPVTLSLVQGEDIGVLRREGTPGLREVRLGRICEEAYRQGGVLSHEDLSLLLGVDVSTVRRLVAGCAARGLRPPTRGLVEDIGPTVSHKERVVALYFAGHLPQGIAVRTGHSLGSVERYLGDFARVAYLLRQGSAQESVVRATGLSRRVVSEYSCLWERHDTLSNAMVMERLIGRFGGAGAEVEEGGRHG